MYKRTQKVAIRVLFKKSLKKRARGTGIEHTAHSAHSHEVVLSEAQASWLLRESNFRATKGRIELLTALASSHAPQSAAELAKKLGRALDEANVYRALKAFSARGLARMVQYERDRARFEFAEGEHHHHHLICTDCGVVEHIDIPSESSLEREALRASRSFSSVSAHALEFSGICDTCASS